MHKEMGKWGAAAGVAATVGAVLLSGCECAPPVRESLETRTVVDVSKTTCPPVKIKQTVTFIRQTDTACPALPPVGEITVVRNNCDRTKMVFVSVRPSDDRYYNVQDRSFERPWPWGPYGMGCDN
jgi:hypothetical protein